MLELTCHVLETIRGGCVKQATSKLRGTGEQAMLPLGAGLLSN